MTFVDVTGHTLANNKPIIDMANPALNHKETARRLDFL